MPNFKKNQMNQILFPIVDGTDFASVESGLTASDFESRMTKKFFGANHGVSDAFTSGTISKAATLVRSGLFKQTLKASETNYDYVVYRFIPNNASLAEQILIFQPEEIDPSDAYSLLSDLFSDFQSRVTKAVATNSQLSDLHSDLRSFLVVMSGVQSDIYSALSDFQSDFGSRVPKRVATESQLSDLHSDLRSFMVVLSGVQSDVHSGVQLLESAFIGHTGSTASQVTDPSTVEIDGINHNDQFNGYYFKVLGGSQIDELRLIVDTQITPSHIIVKPAFNSRLASAVDYVILAGNPFQSDMHSDIMSRVSDVGSDLRSFLVAISAALSDVESQVDLLTTSNYLSQVHSDLRSQIGGITASVSASDISDIASRVWSEKYNVYSLLASSFGSFVVQQTQGSSNLLSSISGIASDAASAAAQGNSRILVVQSLVSDVDSQLLLNASMISDVQSALDSQFVYLSAAISDAHSDLYSAIGGVTATLSVSNISDIASRVWSEKYNVYSLLASSFGSFVTQQVQGASNLLSSISGIASDAHSAAILGASHASDAYSAALLILSLASDIDSALTSQFTYLSNAISDMHSDLRSQIGGLTVNVTASDMSDIASRVWATAEGTRVDSRILVIQSLVSDVDSQLLLNASVISDVQSALDSQFTYLSGAISDAHSDLRSQIGGITASVSASDISDIASAVWAAKYTAHSAASSFGSLFSDVYSRLALTQSNVSDIESQLDVTHSLLSDVESQVDLLATSNYLSQVHSDLRSQVGGITAAVTASDMSDIASRVWATAEGTRVDSRILVIQSLVSDVDSQLTVNFDLESDIYSLLSDVQSDFQSRVPKAVATNSQLSDVQSDLRSYLAGISGAISDVESQIDAGVTIGASSLSDISSRVNVEVVDVLRTDTIPDSYATDGVQPTIAQAILAIQQFLQERAVSGTTVTVKKPDGTTTAMTLTLNDSASPTSITRAS